MSDAPSTTSIDRPGAAAVGPARAPLAGGPYWAARRRISGVFRTAQFRWWIAGQARRGVVIHPTLEILGPRNWRDAARFRDGSRIDRDCSLWISTDAGADARFALGAGAYVGRNTFLGAYRPLSIGDRALVGAYCYIISANHRYERRDVPIREQGFTGAPIVIEEDAWLGTHVVVLPGVTIGRGAIIAAGSVVNRDVPAWQIWGGMPARFIKERP